MALIVLFSAAVSARGASAQERPGIVVGSPFGNLIVGLHLPLRSRLAIRPDFSWGMTNRGFTSGGRQSNTAFTYGLATLHYLGDSGARRDYLVPRITYRLTEYETGQRWGQYELSAAFGRQAEVVERFTLWAEAGAAFTYSESRIDGALIESVRVANLMARLGVILRL